MRFSNSFGAYQEVTWQHKSPKQLVSISSRRIDLIRPPRRIHLSVPNPKSQNRHAFLDWSSDLYYIHISWFNICVFVFENSINWWMLWQWGGGRQENINLNCYQIFNRWYVCLFMYFLSLSSLLCHHHLDLNSQHLFVIPIAPTSSEF